MENEKHKRGNYLIIGTKGDYRIMEQFGNYRMLKKVFKTLSSAEKKVDTMVEK